MRRSAGVVVGLVVLAGACLATASGALAASSSESANPQVLRVGSYKGVPGQFKTIQAAVDAAKPGDWVLVGPGDYKTTGSVAPSGHPDVPAGVLITQAGLYLRGMNRNTVIVDGTKPGSPPCSSAAADQSFGPMLSGKPGGLNGVMVWKANDVWVQNLTTCNFLGGSGDAGNGIWWNGGANTYGTVGGIGGHGFLGSYLNATSTFYNGETSAATYGIFSSNWSGGTWDQTYASNFNDSGYYIGACSQQCNQVINHAWSEYNALGYSGSNSGGSMLIENSQFDYNKDGFDTNSQNGDNPPPQNGSCPAGVKPPLAGAPTCWVFANNYVHDNNNPNVPASGSAAAGPVGTGMSLSGARNDTIMNNRFVNNNAWGVILVPYPDSGPPCTGGTVDGLGPGSCLFDEWGDHIVGNQFGNNGSFGHPSNGDFAEFNFQSGHPISCYSGNTRIGGGSLTADAAMLQQKYPVCNGSPGTALGSSNLLFLTEALCDSQVSLVPGQPVLCPTGAYPRRTKVVMHALPTSQLPTMPNVCGGVPADPWCGGQTVKVKGCTAAKATLKLQLPVVESFKSVTITLGGTTNTYKASGKAFRRRLSLGSKGKTRVGVLERIRVAGHAEQVSFTKVYTHC
jgi:hypothetical protein